MPLKIKIYKETYPEFYIRLLYAFGEFVPEEVILGKEREDYSIWFVKETVTNKSLFAKAFENKISGEKYWYNRLSLYDNLDDGDHRKENASIMLTAFKLMGFNLPERYKSERSVVIQAQVLYQQFLEKYMSSYLKLNPDKVLYDNESATVFNPEDTYSVLNATEIEKDENKSLEQKKEKISSSNVIITAFKKEPIQDLISEFYECISSNNFYNAYISCLSGEGMKAFENAQNLCKGYIWTTYLDIQIVTIEQSNSIFDKNYDYTVDATCIAYIAEHIDTALACKLLHLDHTSNNVQKIYNITELMQTAKKIDYISIADNEQVANLYIKIWDDLAFKKMNNHHYELNSSKKFTRLYKFNLLYSNNRYYINSIKPIDKIEPSEI